MKNMVLAAAVSAALMGAGQAAAGSMDAEIQALKDRINELEQRQSAEKATASSASNWSDKVTISGAVEVEAGFVDSPSGDESDITLATVELGVDMQVTDWVSGHVLFLFEEDDTEQVEVDEGIITIGNPDQSPMYVALGRMYLPFGNYESNMLSDPLTLDIGESRESAIQVGYEADGLYGSAFLSNGDTKDGGDDKIENFGANFGFSQETDSLAFDMGVSWVNNIADSDGITDGVTDADNLADKVSGVGTYVIVGMGPFGFIGEYVAATESFDAADLAFGGNGAKPEAWNLEVGYSFEMAGKEATFAVAVQGTEEALALGLPESRYLASLSVGIMDNLGLAFEWARDEDYGVGDGGTGDDTDSITVQLALEF